MLLHHLHRMSLCRYLTYSDWSPSPSLPASVWNHWQTQRSYVESRQRQLISLTPIFSHSSSYSAVSFHSFFPVYLWYLSTLLLHHLLISPSLPPYRPLPPSLLTVLSLPPLLPLQLTWMCHRVMEESTFNTGSEHIISYLPLSHIATQLLDVFTIMACAGTCWFAQPDAFKGSLLQTMKEIRPTIFLGVPRSVGVCHLRLNYH